MECLATFVVLVVLPLAIAALVVAMRARRSARHAADETARLAQTVAALSAALRRDAVTAAPAPGAAAAAATASPASPASQDAAPAAVAQVPPAGDMAAEPAVMTPPLAAAPPSPVPTAATIAAATPAAVAWPAPPSPPPAGTAAAPQRRGPSLEERLGARLPVWIGAIALILAAAYLVKYSVDQGWIDPTVRVTLGALFGVALLIGGELLRRSSAMVAQGLSAAGIAVLFIIELAALHLYHLISPATGFALLALTTATAVALALRQGPIVALLGLVGGFLTPALVSTGHPDARLLFGYLALLQAGLLAVSRRRAWSPLAGLTLLGALAWAGGWSVGPLAVDDAWPIGIFLVVTVIATLVASAGSGTRWGEPLGAWVRAGAAGGALVVAVALAVRTDYGLVAWGFVGLLAAACLLLARLAPQLEGLAWLASGAVCIILGAWAERLVVADAPHFFGVAAAALLLLGGGAWALQRGAPRPARWAALAALASVVVNLVAWQGAHVAGVELPWGWIELGLAALWIVLALPAARGRASLAGGDAVLAAAAAAATTLVSLAVPMELDRQWIGVAWALEVAALVWLAGRLRVPLLAHLAALLTVLVGARLLLNPEVLNYPTGAHPLASWLWYGYGVPIAALAAATVLARRQERRALAAGTGGVGVALAVMFVGLAVRQAFHPGDLDAAPAFEEWGALTTLWLALACGLLMAAARLARPAGAAALAPSPAEPTADAVAPPRSGHPFPELRWGGALLVCLAIGQAFLAQVLFASPLWSHIAVGARPVLNALLLAYGAPLVLLVAATNLERRLQDRWSPRFWLLPRLWSIAALLLLFVLVTLEVRQAFHGAYLDGGTASSGEQYAYSAAWVLLASLLLIAGLVRSRRMLRVASLPVMLLAVGKVFLYDTANLSDLYRVFSFLGLGLSLLLLAWLYQRFVFRSTPEPS